MIILLSLFACQPDKEPAATTESAAPEEPMPEVWGVAPAEDHDPSPDVVEVHLQAALTTVEWVEGESTEVWAYNGQIPGPLIQVRLGQTLRVMFENDLEEDETTIHWHGMRISDQMDGVPMIQDPVQPGESFTYEFTPPDPGSYWYHPHVSANEQIERGLQGVLIVHEPDAPAVDKDRYFVLDDASLRSNGSLYGFAMDHMTRMMGRWGNTLLVNGQTSMLTDTVRPGSVERWRIVNTANARPMYISISGADLRVVATDGTRLAEPWTDDGRIEVPIGRRFDLEVIPHLDAETVTLINEVRDGYQWEEIPIFEATVAGDPGPGEPLDWAAPTLPEVEEPVQEVSVTLDAGEDEDGALIWTVNGEAYGDHSEIPVSGNTPTRITLTDASGLDHPFHLHGQFFQVLSREDRQLDRDRGHLDTVMVGARETLVLYTSFDNPGVWMAHCHILEHAELGMMAELVVSE